MKRTLSSEQTVEVTVARDLSALVRPRRKGEAYLVVIAGGRPGQHQLLDEREVDIGRGTACVMQLDADSVSRQHARVHWDGARHVATDLKSTNGTFVNEARISGAHPLRDQDRLQIGHVILKYIAGDNVEVAYHEEIQRLMRFDGLTGVANRAHFDEELTSLIWRSRTRALPITLIAMDIDRFKSVNDTLGHAAGDAVLRQAAAVASAQVPSDCLFARTGGEEFAVLCPGQVHAAGITLAERIRHQVEAATMTFDQKRIPVTVSLGVAERPVGGSETADQLYARADAQLYAAKGAGRNCVR